jgi:hypothetical protein
MRQWPLMVFAMVLGASPGWGQATPTLSGDKARQKGICGAPIDSLSDVTRLWQIARATLDASRSRVGADDATVMVQFFDRRVARNGKVLDSGSTNTRQVSAHRPYRSLPPDSVASVGYVIETAQEVSYYAPDAEVLLSAPFAATHCFGIQTPPSSSPTWIGLSFRPRGERDDVREIAGTFWFDRQSLVLQRLEFRYTNVPTAYLTAKVGGDLSFSRLHTGAWIINRWEIRMPQGNVSSQLLLNNNGKTTQRQAVVESLRVAGGEVTATLEKRE